MDDTNVIRLVEQGEIKVYDRRTYKRAMLRLRDLVEDVRVDLECVEKGGTPMVGALMTIEALLNDMSNGYLWQE